MRETILKRFFSGDISVDALVHDLQGSVVRLNNIESAVEVEDMQESFPLSRAHVVMLCDTTLSGCLAPEDLATIAFVLMASDRFEWDDETVSEVLSDWACPEVNLPLNEQTLNMHRSWLKSDSDPPSRAIVLPNDSERRLVSVRRKVSPNQLDH
jgi:hypothetical protein